MLVPLSEEEASAWLTIFCDPICGATLLVPLLSGATIPERRSSMSSLDAFSASATNKVEDLFVTVPPESLRTRRKSVTTTTGLINTSSDTSSPSLQNTATVMEQSSTAMDLAKELMQQSAEAAVDVATTDVGEARDGDDIIDSVDLEDESSATL